MTRPRKRRRRRRLPEAQSSRQGSARLALVLAVLVGVNLYVFLWRGGTSIPDVMEKAAVAGKTELGARGMAGLEPEPEPEPKPPPEPEYDVVKGEVGSGDSIDSILQGAGLEVARAHEVIEALRPHMDFRAIKAGQEYRIELEHDGSFRAFEFVVSQVTRVRAEADPDGAITAEKLETETRTRVEEVGGTIQSSLYETVIDAGEDTSLVSFFVDVFAYDLNFYIDTHPGDTFRMIVEKEYIDGEFYRYGDVLAAEYSGRAGTFRAFRWQIPDKEPKYYDEDGRSIAKSLLKTPLKFTRISSKFNPRRMHPVLHVRRGHHGVDYAAPRGTPVWAAGTGKIVRRGWAGGAGRMVVVRHDSGMRTIYMHLSRFRKGQRVGQRVRQKTVIGYVGASGLATGPHLHFGVKKNGRYVDPLELELEPGPPVPDRYMGDFRSDTGQLVARLESVPVEDDPWRRFTRALATMSLSR